MNWKTFATFLWPIAALGFAIAQVDPVYVCTCVLCGVIVGASK